jgi:O-methyltransferase involved in polyketide biosynthesis
MIMDKSEDLPLDVSELSETLLIPLYARAIESRSKDPIIIDRRAVEITQALNESFQHSDSKLHKRLLAGKLRRWSGKQLAVALSLRTRRFDRYCLDFLKRNPSGNVVELGCGLSTRFTRIGNEKVRWYDLDLPEVIRIKERFFNETDNYRFIRSSVTDLEWMNTIDHCDGPVLFIAEGLLMYLHENEVRSFIIALQNKFPGCELACEVVSAFVVRTLNRKLWRRKFQKDHCLGEGVTFNFGINEGSDLEKWHEGIELLDEWTYFDERERKLGWMGLLGQFKKLRKTQWIVHYTLH